MSPALPFLSVADAARQLGVSPGRVRELIRSGQLDAERVGRTLLVSADSVRRRLQVVRPAVGRPLSPRMAWAFLWRLSGVQPPWSTPAERVRVNKYVHRLSVEQWPRMLAKRADQHRVRMLPGPISRLRQDPRVVVGGVAAASHYGVDLVGDVDDVELYVEPDCFDDLVARKRVNLDPQVPNVVIRVPLFPGVLRFNDDHVGFAPPAAVAADLVDSGDERSVRAARQLCSAYSED
jgi:excisionase family DNA binding protein